MSYGNHFSASGINISGSTVDVISTIETLTGKTNVAVKKIYLTTGSSPNKVMINGNSYWSDILYSSTGSYVFATDMGDILISHLYLQNATGSKLSLDVIY